MTHATKMWLYWTPRVACLLFALLLGSFAFDAFTQGREASDNLLNLLIHLIPTGLVLAALIVSWNHEWIGGLAFLGLAVAYAVFYARGRVDWILAISGPLVLVGVLFLIDWKFRRQLHER
jgi:hypothetical protein